MQYIEKIFEKMYLNTTDVCRIQLDNTQYIILLRCIFDTLLLLSPSPASEYAHCAAKRLLVGSTRIRVQKYLVVDYEGLVSVWKGLISGWREGAWRNLLAGWREVFWWYLLVG